MLNRLVGRNKLHIVRPHRLEIEIQILHSSELGPELKRVLRELRLRGVTVYANTPLLGHINDNEDEMLRISYACRELGVEYNNVYVTGTSLQRGWNDEHPIDLNSVIDIATHARRYGSGREVPRYLFRTALGAVDYGITPRMLSLDDDRQVQVTLRPHNLDYYRQIDPEFEWPEGTELSDDGHPVVPIEGVFHASQASRAEWNRYSSRRRSMMEIHCPTGSPMASARWRATPLKMAWDTSPILGTGPGDGLVAIKTRDATSQLYQIGHWPCSSRARASR